MNKEEIIKDLEPILYGASLFPVANTLLAKFEQEKKEQARDIIIRFKSFLETQSKTVKELSKSKSRYAIPENCVECYEGSQENRIEELKRIAKEYGVEL